MARAPDIQDDPARSLALAYGLALASAELAWLDGALIELSPAG
jgi:hypothetical protein